MAHPTAPATTMATFVIRFWYETSAGEVRWRGQIEHVQSRQRVAFLTAEGMLTFMGRFGIAVGAESADERGDHVLEEGRRMPCESCFTRLKSDRQQRRSRMARIEKSIIIDAPVEAVFNYVEDPANLPEYWPSVVEVKAVEQLPSGGARMTIAYKMAGVRFDVETACTEYAPNQRTVYVSEGPVSSTVTWTYEPHNGGTRATVVNEYTVQLPVLRKLGESFLVRVSENEAEAILGNVKAKMEA